MNNLESIASDVALLSNDSLMKLAEILIKDYEPRANVLQTMLYIVQQEEETVDN